VQTPRAGNPASARTPLSAESGATRAAGTAVTASRPAAHSPRLSRSLATALAPSASLAQPMHGDLLVYKGESGRSANWNSRQRTTTLQSRTEPLEIISCKLTKNLTTFYLTIPICICCYSSLP
jgi:hypothetical protein